MYSITLELQGKIENLWKFQSFCCKYEFTKSLFINFGAKKNNNCWLK